MPIGVSGRVTIQIKQRSGDVTIQKRIVLRHEMDIIATQWFVAAVRANGLLPTETARNGTGRHGTKRIRNQSRRVNVGGLTKTESMFELMVEITLTFVVHVSLLRPVVLLRPNGRKFARSKTIYAQFAEEKEI